MRLWGKWLKARLGLRSVEISFVRDVSTDRRDEAELRLLGEFLRRRHFGCDFRTIVDGFQLWCVVEEKSGGGGLVAVTLRALVQTFNESASFVLGNFRFIIGTKLSSKFQHPS